MFMEGSSSEVDHKLARHAGTGQRGLNRGQRVPEQLGPSGFTYGPLSVTKPRELAHQHGMNGLGGST